MYEQTRTRWDCLDVDGRRAVQRQIYRLQVEQEERAGRVGSLHHGEGRLGHEDHARSSSEGAVVDGAVHAGGAATGRRPPPASGEPVIRAVAQDAETAGLMGVNIDRVVMLMANVQTIRDVILFPLMRPE